ncbi:putative uncharacterized protein MGC34800 [Oryctolagus cuniculus]|uniref:putative uncharacterized protein MGC34800 n=1 Tax=Oryctolagus cuniculus TaxID=9986 RepID=UPI003879C19C
MGGGIARHPRGLRRLRGRVGRGAEAESQARSGAALLASEQVEPVASPSCSAHVHGSASPAQPTSIFPGQLRGPEPPPPTKGCIAGPRAGSPPSPQQGLRLPAPLPCPRLLHQPQGGSAPGA